MKEIEVGQLWRVITEDFLTSKKDPTKTLSRQLKLDKGEIIEIRYAFAWHFRTVDNHYLHAEPEIIIKNCEYVGTIWPRIKSANKAKTEEIYRLGLFD